jgi:putative transposase
MIDRSHDLPVARQALALGISRGSVYYLPRPVAASDLVVMRRIDELHLNFPFAGSRMLRDLLAGEGFAVGRLHVATLMKRMGIEALYRRPSTSKPAPGHKIYPYLLRKLAVTRPDQVWAMDITYIPMARGLVYMAAVVDWFSRRVLAWRLSITMEACRDNVFVERLWRRSNTRRYTCAPTRRTRLTRQIHRLLQLASTASARFEVESLFERTLIRYRAIFWMMARCVRARDKGWPLSAASASTRSPVARLLPRQRESERRMVDSETDHHHDGIVRFYFASQSPCA